MDNIVVKYASNSCVVDTIQLPEDGLAIVAVPNKKGMRLYCNCQLTAELLGAEFEEDVIEPDDSSVRYSVQFDFKNRRDEGRFALLNMLRNAQYGVQEQGGVPWHILGIR
jgi:hypothetical protein